MKRALRRWWIAILCCSPGVGTTLFVILVIANRGSAAGISIDWLLRNCSLLAVPMLTFLACLALMILLKGQQGQRAEVAKNECSVSGETPLSKPDR